MGDVKQNKEQSAIRNLNGNTFGTSIISWPFFSAKCNISWHMEKKRKSILVIWLITTLSVAEKSRYYRLIIAWQLTKNRKKFKNKIFTEIIHKLVHQQRGLWCSLWENNGSCCGLSENPNSWNLRSQNKSIVMLLFDWPAVIRWTAANEWYSVACTLEGWTDIT